MEIFFELGKVAESVKVVGAEVLKKTDRDLLVEEAVGLDIKFPKNISTEKLIALIETVKTELESK